MLQLNKRKSGGNFGSNEKRSKSKKTRERFSPEKTFFLVISQTQNHPKSANMTEFGVLLWRLLRKIEFLRNKPAKAFMYLER